MFAIKRMLIVLGTLKPYGRITYKIIAISLRTLDCFTAYVQTSLEQILINCESLLVCLRFSSADDLMKIIK